MTSILELSRRDFMKLSAAGALGMLLPELELAPAAAQEAPTQGRMTVSGIPLYDSPSFNGEKLSLFGRDEIVNISRQVEGDNGNPFNNAWYQIGEGYSYSGWIQPVKTEYQKPVFEVPEVGQLGEITVPVCDPRLVPSSYSKRGYRIYYGTTHWVKKTIVVREEKSIWYEIYDSHMHKSFFVPWHDMRLVPDEELKLLSPQTGETEKSIHVDLAAQLVTAFEGDTMVFSSRCSSGARGTRTPEGDFLTYHKGPSIHMTNEGDDEANIYDLPGVPWCTFFTGMGNAFHGTYWHNDFGRPRSHGCVNLPSESAKFLYLWSRPEVPAGEDYLHLPGEGTRVIIRSSDP